MIRLLLTFDLLKDIVVSIYISVFLRYIIYNWSTRISDRFQDVGWKVYIGRFSTECRLYLLIYRLCLSSLQMRTRPFPSDDGRERRPSCPRHHSDLVGQGVLSFWFNVVIPFGITPLVRRSRPESFVIPRHLLCVEDCRGDETMILRWTTPQPEVSFCLSPKTGRKVQI